MIGLSEENLDHYLATGPYVSDRFTVRAFKILADGALGSRGACLLHPYADAATSGFLLFSPQAIDSAVARIVDSDFQVATHAIGDSTNRLILDIYGKYLKGENDRRWRIEHAQIISPIDFEDFGTYDIIPSVQPTHATSDMYWAGARVGPTRINGAYAYRRLLEEAGLLALGSDFPVDHINPLYGFHAAVARVDKNDYPEGGFQPENAIDREAALRVPRSPAQCHRLAQRDARQHDRVWDEPLQLVHRRIEGVRVFNRRTRCGEERVRAESAQPRPGGR